MVDEAAYSDVLAVFLRHTASRGLSHVRADLLVGGDGDGVEVLSQTAVGRSSAHGPPLGTGGTTSAREATDELFRLLKAGEGHPRLHAAEFQLVGGAWRATQVSQLGRVEPISPPSALGSRRAQHELAPDDPAIVIEDAQVGRQLVLTSAGLLARGLDPVRVDGLLHLLAPFAAPLLPKLGPLARLKGLRVSQDRVLSRGTISSRPLAALTPQEARSALAAVGVNEAPGATFVPRLIERGPLLGIRTLDDLSHILGSGSVRVGRDAGTLEIASRSGNVAVVVNAREQLVEFASLT